MILYNVTVKIDSSLKTDWLKWMREVHIPAVMQTGCFTGQSLLRLRYPKDDEGLTFAIQYSCENMEQLEEYHRTHAAGLQREHKERYGERAVAFRTILERLDENSVAE